MMRPHRRAQSPHFRGQSFIFWPTRLNLNDRWIGQIHKIPIHLFPLQMMNSPIFFAVFFIFQFSISTHSLTPEDKHFAECCKAAGFGKGIIESACKYPPNVRFYQRAIIGLHFAEYLHCYTAKRDNTTCCKENGISDGCLDMCDGVKQPKKALNYAFCEKNQTDSDAINNCNKMGAKKEIGKKKNEMKAEEEE